MLSAEPETQNKISQLQRCKEPVSSPWYKLLQAVRIDMAAYVIDLQRCNSCEHAAIRFFLTTFVRS